jgi:hypothetical protein
MRTRQSLSDVIEGRLSSPAGREELVKLATRLIIEETLEAEARDAVDRDYYEHGAEPGSGYRNGYRPGRLKTAEGAIDYSAPQVAGKPEPFRSAIREHLKGQTQALEDLAIELLARGLSVRDIEDAFRDESGRLLLSRTAVSEIGAPVGGPRALTGPSPGACRNPALAAERARKREELLAASEGDLAKIRAATMRARNPLRGEGAIALKARSVLGRRKVAKHFRLTITEDSFDFARDEAAIAREGGVGSRATGSRRRSRTAQGARGGHAPASSEIRGTGPRGRTRMARGPVSQSGRRAATPPTCGRVVPDD